MSSNDDILGFEEVLQHLEPRKHNDIEPSNEKEILVRTKFTASDIDMLRLFVNISASLL